MSVGKTGRPAKYRIDAELFLQCIEWLIMGERDGIPFDSKDAARALKIPKAAFVRYANAYILGDPLPDELFQKDDEDGD